MMKYSRHALLTAFLAVMVVFMTGCEQAGDSLPVTSSGDESFAETLAIPSPDASAAEMTGGTFDTDMMLHRPGSDARRMMLPVFHCLDLTDAQKQSIAEIIRAGADCPKSILDSLRASEQPLLEAARAARREVIEKVKAGELTREEGRAQLEQINADLRAALQSNPVREWAQAALAECRAAVLNQIRAVLDGTQQAMWDQWIATGELPCDPRDGRPAKDTLRPHDDTTRPHRDGDRPRGRKHGRRG